MAQRQSFSLVLWLGIFIALTATYLIVQKQKPSTPKKHTIFPWSQDEVVFISRVFHKTNENEYTAFERENGEWHMTSPVKEKAHPEMIHRLLDNLSRIQNEQAFVVTNESSWADYGFSPYLYHFVFSNEKGEAFTLDIGSVSVGKNYYYVRLNNTETNYQIATFNLVDLTQDQGAYRWPDIFDIPFDALERVVFFFRGQRITELATNSAGWMMVYPETRSLTNFSVKSLLLDFYPIQADHFITTTSSPTVLRTYGLASPTYGVIFIGNGRSNTLWVSSRGQEGFLYAFSEERQGVFAVSESEVTTKWVTQASQLWHK